ncbi:MPPN domain protein [Cooperia oncophora]
MYSPLLNRSSAMSAAMDNSSMDSSSTGMQKRFSGDNLSDSPAKTPAFLFGQKRRSVAPATPSYINNPYAGQNAPSNDIFASPIPSQLRGESAGNSGKSVHWSPALVQERAHPYDSSRSTLKTLPSQSSGQFTPSSNLSPAPPLRSLRDDIEPVRKVSRRSMSIPVTDSSFSSAAASRSATDQGPVPSRGNWMHIRYSCPIHARQALSRNACLIDSSLRVGVIPCTDKEIVGADASQIVSPLFNRSSMAEQSISEEAPDEIPSITPSKENQDSLNDSMSRSRLTMGSRAGMRSLTISYDSRQDNKDAQPAKHDSIMNRLWTAVGL